MIYLCNILINVTLELVRQLLELSGYHLLKVDENRGVMKRISKLSFEQL